MSSFLRFIGKHTAYLYFLLYCTISIMLMQLQREETLEAIHEQGLAINAVVAKQFTGATAIFTQDRDNQLLFLQNAKLFGKLLRQETARRDTLELNAIRSNAPQWAERFVPARVVDRRFSATDNMLIIDAGSRQGVARDMAVLTPDGLVGRVINVSRNYAKVMPVTNRNFMVSAVCDSTRINGLLSWRNGNEHIAQLEHVPVGSKLLIGDQVETSDYSTFATRGIPIGKIDHIAKDKLFYKVDVRLAVDFSSLSRVLVSLAKPSMEKIELMQSPDIPAKEQ